MSGSIIFAEGSYWFKARWVYRAALDGICEALTEIGGADDLLRELSDEAGLARTVLNIEVCAWDEKKRSEFCRATRAACGIMRARGPKGWKDPSYFPGFLRALDELESLAAKNEKPEANKRPEGTTAKCPISNHSQPPVVPHP